MEQTEWSTLYNYLTLSEYPSSYDKNDKRRLREKSKSFTEVSGVLMHKNKNGKYKRVVFVDEKVAILRATHGGPGAVCRDLTSSINFGSWTT